MWQRLYLQRLKRDLETWIERGWVSPQNAEAILASTGGETATRRMPQVLALLGAVLIGFAAMSFVAANWAEMSKLVKLLLVCGAMWAAYGAAFALERRGHEAFAQAGVTGGLALFGAAIMLIGQIYHLSTDNPAGLLAWCIAALASAWLLPSRPALALGIVLALLWSAFCSAWAAPVGTRVHWAFFLPWAAALALTLRLSWLAGFHLALIAFYAWAVLNAEALAHAIGCEPVELAALYIVQAVALWLLAIAISARSMRFAQAAGGYGVFVAFALLWVLQAAPTESEAGALWLALMAGGLFIAAALVLTNMKAGLLQARDAAGMGVLAASAALYPVFAASPATLPYVYAALFLALAAWLVAHGMNMKNRFALNLGFAAFGIEALYLYFETLGSLLGTAAFFALGGVLLIAGSLFLARLRRRIAGGGEGASS